MNQQIKQCIDQLNKGEVPGGYKKTKVGIVPEEWQVTRFKQKFNRLNRKNAERNANVLTISAQYGLVSQETFFNKSIASDEKSNYFLLHNGEFAYNKSYSNGYPFGAIKRLDNFEKGIVSPLYICFSVSEENKCTDFYLQYFESGRINPEIQAIAQEGARNHGLLNIAVDDFFNMILPVPPLPEQEKIAEILTAQDRVIALLDQKIEQLQKMKKVFLQKMFPAKGQTVPEWRFKGFTAPWEQRKLGEVLSIATRKNGKQYTKENVLSVSDEFGCVNQIRFQGRSFAGEDISNYKVVQTGDIIYTRSPLQAKPYGIIKKVGEETGIVSPLYIVNEVLKNIVPDFIYYCFDSPQKTNNYLSQLVRKGAKNTMNISNDEWLSGDIIISTDYEEQKHIGNCLKKLDNLITLHRQKRDEEKRKKKALMQLLLTGIVRTV